MGIKDQFNEKAQELRGKAAQAAKGAQDEASQRSQQLREKKPQAKRPPADRARDEFDENWDA